SRTQRLRRLRRNRALAPRTFQFLYFWHSKIVTAGPGRSSPHLGALRGFSAMMALPFLRRGDQRLRERPHTFRLLLIAGLVLFSAGALLLAFAPYHWPLVVLRCFGLSLLALAAFQGRSLTLWIFFAMVAGLELGLDAPAFAVQLRVLSDI